MELFLKKLNGFIVIAILSVFIFASCSDDKSSDPKLTETEILLEYLEGTAGDFINELGPQVIPAQTVYEENTAKPDKIHIIDIRATADYNNGYIPNAVNILMADIIDYMKSINASNFDRIVLVCYSGQSAAYTATILRYLGYDNVFTMGFGMCSWHDDFANSWKSKIGNARATQFVSEETAPNTLGSLPTITTGKKNGKDILEARAIKLLTEGYKDVGITHDAVFQNLDGYYIINYWPNDQYKDPGHIPGAVNFIPKQDLRSDKLLKSIPLDKPAVIYCYTGQGSGYASAYLRLLGYDGRSLLYGASSMIYDKLTEKGMSRFTEAAVKNYDYVK